MLMAGAGSLAIGAAGAVVVLLTLIDMLLTIFNYDGFTFLARRFHGGVWKLVRASSMLVPRQLRDAWLAVGSAAMLPATFALWLGLEIAGFAMMFAPGFADGQWTTKNAGTGIGTAFYVSAGAITSLTFGDVAARSGLDRALVDLDTIVGLATFTLALGYVVTAFGALGALENLHGNVRRHAEDPERPSSILSRHFGGGQPSDLPSFLQALGDDLEEYDQGLRRYPVVYYFHTRRTRRSIPHVFAALGDLVALIRWGLPADEPATKDPFLHALRDGYERTLERLRRSFVGPDPLHIPEPLTRAEFERAYAADDAAGDETVAAFKRLEKRARASAGSIGRGDAATTYDRYREWLPFAERQRAVLNRVADRLGYPRPGDVALDEGGDRAT